MTPLVLIATVVGSLCALTALPVMGALFVSADRTLARVSRRPRVAYVCIFLIAMMLAAIPSIVWSPPVPFVSDEFSYLLSADTIARGRLTNPSPPMPAHFEAPHVLVTPTYASKYPIGQGAALAIGQALTGLPIVGAWLSGAMACCAITWAMRAVMPARFAMLSGLLAAMHPLIAWWNNCYWGGNVATAGGALFFGATLRALRNPTRAVGAIMGTGLGILAHTRPLEAAITAAIVLIWLALRVHPAAWWRHFLSRTAPAALIPLSLALALLAYNNYRVTGNALLHPHQLHQKQYLVGTAFFWQRPNYQQTFNSEEMRAYAWDHDFSEQRAQFGTANFLYYFALKGWRLIHQYLDPIVLLPIFALAALRFMTQRTRPASLGRSVSLALAMCLLLPLIHLLISPWTRVAYMAPAFASVVLVCVIGFRELTRWNPPALGKLIGQPLGPLLGRTVVIVVCATWFAYLGPINVAAHQPRAVARKRMVDDRIRSGGKHLIIVRYAPGASTVFDFVSNGADVSSEPVIFAREIDPLDNAALLAKFFDRHAWLLSVDPAAPEPLRIARYLQRH